MTAVGARRPSAQTGLAATYYGRQDVEESAINDYNAIIDVRRLEWQV
jgi:hypothetical protein